MLQTKMLLTREAAEYLKVKTSYLQKMMMKKEIPYTKPNGKLCYFDVADLDKWLQRNRIASNEEIAKQAQIIVIQTKRK